MATLIPAIGTCAGRMTAGERRLAERLEQKLEDDYLLWWDVPIGPKQTRPDFVVLHPRRGALILEVKDWRLDTIRSATRERFEIAPYDQVKVVMCPLQQARHCAIQVVNALERDPQLVQGDGPPQGKRAFPWGHGVVFTNITRRPFDGAGLGDAIPQHLARCKDEIVEDADSEAFQQRLWAMYPHTFGNKGAITLPQLDRVSWILFPEVRVPQQQSLFGADNDGDDEDARLPDIMKVMDLQQEQLARSLGDGHRVIHGVAGSGKTMILGHRDEHLAQTQTAGSKPILVLCYNEPLAVKLASTFKAKGLEEHVDLRHLHKWCHDQLPSDTQRVPVDKLMAEHVQRMITGLDAGNMPAGQYHAILIDKGHDFAPEWLTLVTQMVEPTTNSLRLLYDDAQSLYDRTQKKNFSLRSVGIPAADRTTILKIKYHNTRQILQLTYRMAGDMLKPADAEGNDDAPLLEPLSRVREGPNPIAIDLPTKPKLAVEAADQHAQGHAWGDMAVLCQHYKEIDECVAGLGRKRLQHRKRSGDYQQAEYAIQVMTIHASKRLEWPLVDFACTKSNQNFSEKITKNQMLHRSRQLG